MKKIYVILAAAVAALMAFSCENVLEEEVVNEPVNEPILMKCVIADAPADSKVAVNYSTGKTQWVIGDEILVHGAGSSNRKIVALTAGDISADGKTATIDVSGVTPYDRSSDQKYGSQYYAAYPASLVPSGNLYYNSVFSGELNTYLVSGCDDEHHNTLYFYNMCGLMTFSVNGDYDSYMLVGNGGETVGYTTLASRIANYLESTGWGPDIRYIKSGDGFTCAPLTSVSGALVSDGTTVNTIYFPAGVSLSGGFTIYFKKAGSIVDYVSTSKTVTINPGQLFPVGLIPTSKIHTYVPPTSHDATHPAITGATDLGASGTANCYIVDGSDGSNADKVYKFKAVRGNGAVGVGSIASVVILWETYNNETSVTTNSVIAQADFDKQDGSDDYWITFKMPTDLHEGNAVIAAKDTDDNILWSWHIWVPASTITSNTYGIYGKALMDRNLGALVAATTGSVVPVESFGMLYQWGRKDPFPGSKRINSSSRAKVAGVEAHSTTGDGSDDSSKITLAQSIADPTLLGHKQGGDWISPSDRTLWKDGEKTIYDPCPPGYRVPARDKSQPLHNSDLSTQVGWEDNGTNLYFTLGSPVAVFPYTGYYDQWSSSLSSISSYGKRTVLWTSYSSDSSSEEVAYAESIRTSADGDRHKLEELGKCNTSTVRCCVE